MPHLNAELAEVAESSLGKSCSAVFAVSAFPVIFSQALQTDYRPDEKPAGAV
jgi:hypothetical protein